MGAAVCGAFLAATAAIVATPAMKTTAAAAASPVRLRGARGGESAGAPPFSANVSLVGGGANAGSWRRIACSSARSSAPGSIPNSLDERLPAVAVARKRVGLSTVAVEGEHQLPEHLLVERLGRDPRAPDRG